MKKVVVIGSNSFSGSNFIDLLLAKERFSVIGVSRSEEKSALFLPYKKRNSAQFAFHQIDLNKDLLKLEQIIDAFRPEYIVNFAAQSEVAPSWEHPDQWFQTNAVAITRLANLLKDKKYLEKYVHISSPEVYGSCEGIVTEESSMNPTTPYAASKAAGDFSLFTFYKNFKFPLVMIRATNVYGPCQQLFKIIPRSALYIKGNKKIELHGGGIAIKSYIHIDDVSEGELLAMEKGEIGQIYHFSPDSGVSVRRVVETICSSLKASFDQSVVIAPERLGQDKAYVIDSTKARRTLSWKPKISLNNGIDQTIKWILDNYETLSKCSLSYVHKE